MDFPKIHPYSFLSFHFLTWLYYSVTKVSFQYFYVTLVTFRENAQKQYVTFVSFFTNLWSFLCFGKDFINYAKIQVLLQVL